MMVLAVLFSVAASIGVLSVTWDIITLNDTIAEQRARIVELEASCAR